MCYNKQQSFSFIVTKRGFSILQPNLKIKLYFIELVLANKIHRTQLNRCRICSLKVHIISVNCETDMQRVLLKVHSLLLVNYTVLLFRCASSINRSLVCSGRLHIKLVIFAAYCRSARPIYNFAETTNRKKHLPTTLESVRNYGDVNGLIMLRFRNGFISSSERTTKVAAVLKR